MVQLSRCKNELICKQLHHMKIGRRADDTGLLREEIQVLREEMHILRDKNHHLVQENIKLTECIKDLQQFSSHPLLAKTEASYEDHTQDDDVYSVSWMSKIKGFSYVIILIAAYNSFLSAVMTRLSEGYAVNQLYFPKFDHILDVILQVCVYD